MAEVHKVRLNLYWYWLALTSAQVNFRGEPSWQLGYRLLLVLNELQEPSQLGVYHFLSRQVTRHLAIIA